MRVPGEPFQGRTGPRSPPWQTTSAPRVSSGGRDCSDTWATPPMEARASPRKPRVWTRKRSSASWSLLVAWAAKASGRSSAWTPQPSSATRISSTPPCSTSTSTRRAPASMAFSRSSLRTLAGRSMTSPAAILLTTSGGSWRMRGIGRFSRGRLSVLAALARCELFTGIGLRRLQWHRRLAGSLHPPRDHQRRGSCPGSGPTLLSCDPVRPTPPPRN